MSNQHTLTVTTDPWVRPIIGLPATQLAITETSDPWVRAPSTGKVRTSVPEIHDPLHVQLGDWWRGLSTTTKVVGGAALSAPGLFTIGYLGVDQLYHEPMRLPAMAAAMDLLVERVHNPDMTQAEEMELIQAHYDQHFANDAAAPLFHDFFLTQVRPMATELSFTRLGSDGGPTLREALADLSYEEGKALVAYILEDPEFAAAPEVPATDVDSLDEPLEATEPAAEEQNSAEFVVSSFEDDDIDWSNVPTGDDVALAVVEPVSFMDSLEGIAV